MPITAETTPGQRPSKRLTILDLVGQACAIGPLIGIGLFLAFVAQIAGGRGPLAILLAAIGMVCFAMVIAFYASFTGGAGAVGDYVERAWGRRAGMAILIIYTFSLLVSGAGGFSIAVGVLVANFSKAYLFGLVPWWGGALIVVLIAWIMNVRGADVATRAQLVIVLVSVIPFLLTAAAAIIHAGPANTWDFFSIFHFRGEGNLFGGLLFAILLFGGFETVAVLAEETPNPRRTIPLALISTVVLTGILFVLCSYAGTVYFGPELVGKAWPAQLDGFAEMANKLLGNWAGMWIRVGIFADFISCFIGFSLAASRGLYALSRAGVLPPVLARTNRLGAPTMASHCVLATALLAIAIGFLIPGHERYKSLFVVATAQGLLLALTYAVLAVGACKIILATGRSSLPRWVVLVIASAMPILALYGSLFPFPQGPEQWGVWGAFAAIFLAVVGSLVWKPGASRP